MDFPSMTTEELVARYQELHGWLVLESRLDSRREIRSAMLRIVTTVAERAGCFPVKHRYAWVPVVGQATWTEHLSRWGDGWEIDGSGVTFTGRLADGTPVARTYAGSVWAWQDTGEVL
jgi:hypothetical protein